MTRSKNTNRNRRQRQQQGDVQATKPPLPPSMPRSEVLENAAEILDAVRHALADWTGASQISRLKTAVRNFVEQGRSVTWALHHLKGDMPDDEWDEWWTKATAPLQIPFPDSFTT